MRKNTWKRTGLGCAQHMIAAVIMVIVAALLFNSYVSVKSMNGTETHLVNAYGTDGTFEDSKLFNDIFKTAVSDITRLVVIKGQLEDDGVFRPNKHIDVTQYANRKGSGNDCKVTAVYELDDLIKWGKYGVEYNNRSMGLSDFVNYFGPVTSPNYFALNQDGQLYFKGFSQDAPDLLTVEENNGTGETQEEKIEETENKTVEQVWGDYTEEQLEDMVFSYIITQIPQGINMSREDDGTLTVNLSVLNTRYATVTGERQLFSYADNWVDYMKLQNNLVDAITSLSNNYQQYQSCNSLYQENHTNLKYAIRMMTANGLETYTNVSELYDASESEITEYFYEYRRYFIYYPDSLEFYGTSGLTEDDIYGYLREYEYAYPETTHIWIGVDTSYPIKGDAFYNANKVYQRVVPHVNLFIVFFTCLVLGWLLIGVYLTMTAGVTYDEEGNRVYTLNGWDRIWTEVQLLLFGAFLFVCFWGYGRLAEIAREVQGADPDLLVALSMTSVYRYGMYALYGALVSLFFAVFWFSFVRRIRGRNLWRDSFLHYLFSHIQNGIGFIATHGNSAISTLIPYNFFLLVHLSVFFVIYMLSEKTSVVLLTLIVLVVFDGIVGVILFKGNAERMDIVEGIKKIRDGEVEYKLDADSLHGTNREMADAVNNIGEGIRKAVRTSMKDEQMKTDLITNVSHDLKTPLTSIISYVDLLKRLKIEEEPAKSYIDILEVKSQRLKQLTDDLVEVSKISSGNIELHLEELNLTELLNQSIGEFSEKFDDKKLQIVFEESHTPAHIYADSRRMWRIIENLFNNICKYAMEGTRVYIDLDIANQQIKVGLKNISARQMNLRGDDLTERFIRGDASRTTEGSGLGLSIAKSLTEAQGGEFVILLDGDLFTVELIFPEYQKNVEKEPVPL